MTLACLIRRRPHTTYFVNEIHRHHPISLVVVEAPPAGDKLRRLFRRSGFAEAARAVGHRLRPPLHRTETYNALFGDRWGALAPDLEILTVEHVNAPVVRERLDALAPDVLLDHGTSIVRDEILDTAGLALNLHWGLSPYYRGVACTEWALLNWDPYNIGVTIHLLSKHIDGGDILAQRRIDVEPSDRVLSINGKITRAGTEVLVDLLSELRAGRRLRFSAQETDVGFLYLKKHFDDALRRRVRRIERDGLVAQMLEAPARRTPLPIIEWEGAP